MGMSLGEEPADEFEDLLGQGQQCRMGIQRQVFKERISHFRIIVEYSTGRDSRGGKADLQHFCEIPNK